MLTFRKLALVMALGVAMATYTNAFSNTYESSEDDDMVALDFDSFSEELEELGPGDEDLMDSVMYHREMMGSGSGKKSKNGDQDQGSTNGSRGGDGDSDATSSKNRTKGEGLLGLGGKNRTRDDDGDDLGLGKNRTRGDGSSGQGKNNGGKDSGGKNGLPGQGKNHTTKGGDGDDLGLGKNRTKFGGDKSRTEGDGSSGLGGKNRTKGDGSSSQGKGEGKGKKAKDMTKKDKKGMPVWWDAITTNFTKTKKTAGTRLKRCSKRMRAPLGGTSCSKKPKTCYFGTQVCPSELDYPTIMCDCKNRTWTCEAENCASCPVAQPGDGATCSSSNSTCNYGGAVTPSQTLAAPATEVLGTVLRPLNVPIQPAQLSLGRLS